MTIEIDSSGSLVGYLTTNQYAAKYNINIHTVRQWCYRGMLDHVKVGGVKYIKDEAMPVYKYRKPLLSPKNHQTVTQNA